MKIVLSGVGTVNKGAELMLYAILQQIEKRYPNAEVYMPISPVTQGLNHVHTSAKLDYIPISRLRKIAMKIHLQGILRRLNLPYLFVTTPIVKNADYFIDASGFAFSDQRNVNANVVRYWGYILKEYKSQGAKIVFLPQAFGPAEKDDTKTTISYLNKYADLIMPREKVSLKCLQQCKVDENKIRLFTDFTSLVEGKAPERYGHLKGYVCVIPNLKMIESGTMTLDKYVAILVAIIEKARKLGRGVYLLNHEGLGDEKLAYMCQKELKDDIEVVTGLNALEVKGLISTAYVCVTSRFHGVASALNSCVPCLATSWSHKYEELFKDYGMNDCVLDLNDTDSIAKKMEEYLDEENNERIREHLTDQLPKMKAEAEDMWDAVWSL